MKKTSTSQVHLFMFEPEYDLKYEWTKQTTHGKTLTTKNTEWTAVYEHVQQTEFIHTLTSHF